MYAYIHVSALDEFQSITDRTMGGNISSSSLIQFIVRYTEKSIIPFEKNMVAKETN